MEKLLFSLAEFRLFHPVENLGEMLFYTLFGFLFVVLGITVLILIFTGLGAIMKRVTRPPKPEPRPQSRSETADAEVGATAEEGISPELVAVISAAIAAYYEEQPQKCAFVVRRIKRR